MARDKRELTLTEIEAEESALTDFQFAIIDAMNERGISQADFAGMLGVSRARVSQLLSPEANPTLKLVGRALKALDIRSNYVGPNSAETHKEYDFWQVFVEKVEASQVSVSCFTPAQVKIFKSRATQRETLWSVDPANENHSEPKGLVVA